MTSQWLDALGFLSLIGALFWLAFFWVVTFGNRLIHVLAPHWRQLIHALQRRSWDYSIKRVTE